MPLRQRRVPMLGQRYHYHYGYPWRWAILAEIAWRIEHLGYYRGEDGGLFGIVRRWGYVKRHHFEHRGIACR